MSTIDNPVSEETAVLPTLYQQQIHQSKYARWDDNLGRRETWTESVNRYIDFVFDHADDKYGLNDNEMRERCRFFMTSQDVLGSMRALMTAGPALARDEVAAYNCAYLAINRPAAFWEAMYVLMCGTGVGFSVESADVSNLSGVPTLQKTRSVIKVDDSKIGWAEALRRVLQSLWFGYVPSWDLSEVRPAGSILKTFGGRASGPEPLDNLLNFVVGVFTGAQGRRLTTSECHAIMCKIGEVVVVGGVRRSALISLSDVDDQEMRYAKHGEWWVDNPHYRLSNNSAVWETKPTREDFDREWAALVASGSGERGLFNREAARYKASVLGNRRADDKYGLNPCVTSDTWVFTSEGPRQVNDLINKKHETIVNGQVLETTDEGFWLTGIKEVLHVSTEEGLNLRLTANHKVLTDAGWVEAGSLNVGDEVILNNHRDFSGWPGEGNFMEGWLLGELIGDGNFSGKTAQVKFWGNSQQEMLEQAVEYIHATVGGRSDLTGHEHKDYSVAQSTKLAELAASFGVNRDYKFFSSKMEKGSSSFVRGVLQGLFDADGSIQGTQLKGVSVRLHQNNLDTLKAAQRSLLRLGIKSKIYRNRREAGMRKLPDGNGNLKEYWCEANHELIIANDSLFLFRDKVGFSEPEKSLKLDELLSSYKRTPNKTKFTAVVQSVLPDGEEAVYDCSVPGINAFDANGIYVHNCGEIILRDREFCNLSQSTVRPDDELSFLSEKIEVATILGTLQSTFTNFRYLSKKWKENCEDERLLGVGMTGVMEHPVLSGQEGDDDLIYFLSELKEKVVDTNTDLAKRLKINKSASPTCMKPAGNSTQLVGAHGSGMHEAHSHFYIRRNRGNKHDPVAQLLYYSGIPAEDDILSPDETWVFSYPMRVDNGAVVRDDRTALDRLHHWLIYAEEWCTHNPSMTVNVKPEEWEGVQDWVFEHLDRMVGVSFLPHSDHTYQQAPYEEITEEQYLALKAEMPEEIDWSMLQHLEKEDKTEGVQELACFGGSCEV